MEQRCGDEDISIDRLTGVGVIAGSEQIVDVAQYPHHMSGSVIATVRLGLAGEEVLYCRVRTRTGQRLPGPADFRSGVVHSQRLDVHGQEPARDTAVSLQIT